MYKVNGLLSFPARRGLHQLDFRAPEDSMSVDGDDETEIRSPGIDRMIKAYYDADHAGDDSEKAEALRGMIDEMTALHKLRGVPIYAHPPLPPQFVAEQVDVASHAGGTDVVSKIASLIEPNNRPAVRMQLEGLLANQRESLTGIQRRGVGLWGGEHRAAFEQAGGKDIRFAIPSSGLIYEEYDLPADPPPARQRGRDAVRGTQVSLALPAMANVTAQGQLTDVAIETPGFKNWGPTNHKAANVMMTRVKIVGAAIQQFGTDEEKKAWSLIKRIVLDDKPLGTGGAAENDNDILRVDLSRVAPGANPMKDIDEAYALFLLAHEIFHSTASDRKARIAANGMPLPPSMEAGDIGSPQWSAEVRNDKRVYDFLVRAKLIDPSTTPIERIAPYYAQHLRNPHVPVVAFPGVPGYDEPMP